MTDRPQPVQTVEMTSKKWKAMQLIGVLVSVVAGALWALIPFPGANALAWFFFGGLAVWIIGRIMAWWHHG